MIKLIEEGYRALIFFALLQKTPVTDKCIEITGDIYEVASEMAKEVMLKRKAHGHD